MTLTIDLVPHMDAGDRTKWRGDQDTRPLSEFGERQARAQAAALAAKPIDALYAGPALRCRETLEPLAERPGLEIVVLPEIGEFEAWRAPDGWDADGNRGANVAAHGAGSALAGVTRMRALHSEGRVIACSHGHVIPALVSFLIAENDLAGVPELTKRGQWYRLRFEDELVQIELREVEGFPTE